MDKLTHNEQRRIAQAIVSIADSLKIISDLAETNILEATKKVIGLMEDDARLKRY